MKKTAIIFIGMSGSGKSTFAKELLKEDNSFYEINRDEIRFEIINPNGCWETWDWGKESLVTEYWNNYLDYGVMLGVNLILSDTNLNFKYLNPVIDKLVREGYNVQYMVMDIPVEECIRRDSLRGDMSVGESVILKQHHKFTEVKKKLKGVENVHILSIGDVITKE